MKYTRNKKVNQLKLLSEIKAASFSSKFYNLYTYGDDVVFESSSDLTTAEESEFDTIINNHNIVDINQLKINKNLEIDKKTSDLISVGFTFNGNVFSMSSDAQRNWMGLKQFSSSLSFPINVSTIDDGEYSLKLSDLDTFVLTAIGTVQTHIDSGRALKVAVKNATTVAELDAIVDAR